MCWIELDVGVEEVVVRSEYFSCRLVRVSDASLGAAVLLLLVVVDVACRETYRRLE